MEMVLGLPTYLETVVARSTVTLLKLRRQQFDRIFKRRYATQALETIKHYLAQRLCLYIYQCPSNDAAFLKFINIRLADDTQLKHLRKTTFDDGGVFSGGAVSKESRDLVDQRTELMKRLHMPRGAELSLPAEDMSEVAVANMNQRLKAWSHNSQLNGGKLLMIQHSRLPQVGAMAVGRVSRCMGLVVSGGQ